MPKNMHRAVVAAGHPKTAEAAAEVLAEGGNAADAALAALAMACVVEPVLASLGGGGFLLAAGPDFEAAGGPGTAGAVLLDFFTQTPGRRRPAAELEFVPIQADFGATTQEFHVGLGAAAVPGTVPGLFHAARRLGRLPITRLLAPAAAAARDGVAVNEFQAFLLQVVHPIFVYCDSISAVYGGSDRGLAAAGEAVRNPALADALDALGREGEALYRDGEIGQAIARLSTDQGGHLTADDIAGYEVVERPPLAVDYGGRRILTNPAPSAGGLLIGFALRLLAGQPPGGRDTNDAAARLCHLARVMAATNKARVESAMAADRLLDPAFAQTYAAEVTGRPAAARGTTHISVVDGAGNAVALTTSNGEGCGHVVPGAGFVLNNMLGEEDLHPAGFHRWPVDTRIASMMAPSVVTGGARPPAALGSGGSNRIRTAILQVLINLIDLDMSPEAAVRSPRIHHERGHLEIEGGHPAPVVEALTAAYPDHRLWPDRNLFFGGAHVASGAGPGIAAQGAGDPRRGGIALTV